MTTTPTLQPVTGSSLIAADHWNPDTQTLTVKYHSGSTYDFRGLSPETFEAYDRAESKGKYLKQFIEKNIKGVKIA